MTRIAAVQMCSSPDKQKNLAEAHRLLKDSISEGAKLIAFPENFLFLSDGKEHLIAEAESIDGQTVSTLRTWAQENRVWIQAGGVHLKSDARNLATNSSLLIDDGGTIRARYDKIHLFDVKLSGDREYLESKTIRPGDKCVVTHSPFGMIGLTICYDLRFPELYRRLANLGAEILFAPAAFTAYTGKDHWDVLTRSRAIENQCYLIAAAQEGQHFEGRQSFGSTRIIDPWGRVVAEKKTGVGVITAEIDLEVLKKIRRELPSLQHQRLGRTDGSAGGTVT